MTDSSHCRKDQTAALAELQAVFDAMLANGISARTIERLLVEAKALAGKAWLLENKAAIEAHNERIARHGMLIEPIWLRV